MSIAGENIDNIRKKWGLTVDEFAELLETEPDEINAVIKHSYPLRSKTLDKLSLLSGITGIHFSLRVFETNDLPIKPGAPRNSTAGNPVAIDEIRAQLNRIEEKLDQLLGN